MYSSSTESLDLVGQREKYLKNTFESLSGAEQDSAKDAGNMSFDFCWETVRGTIWEGDTYGKGHHLGGRETHM
jgi:hypothetical protein